MYTSSRMTTASRPGYMLSIARIAVQQHISDQVHAAWYNQTHGRAFVQDLIPSSRFVSVAKSQFGLAICLELVDSCSD